MAFNINTFKSYMPDVVSTANFYVRISNPRCMQGSTYSLEKMSYLCEAAVHPSIRVLTDRNNPYNLSGTVYTTPYAAAVEEVIPMSFYIPNDDPLPVKAFSFWIQQIAGVPNERLLTPSAGKGLKPGQVSYRDEYTTEISIFSLDRSNKNLIETKLFGAFPIQMTQIDLNWASEDYLRLQTQIAFAGVQTITYKKVGFDGEYTVEEDGADRKLTKPVYKKETGFGSSDYADPIYQSEELNIILEGLENLSPTIT